MSFQTVHGHNRAGNKRTPTYNSWRAMRERCTYPRHPRWVDYGGRGIRVCDRWANFENFLEDMGERPEGMTLDRINTNDHYYPPNCKWSTPLQQAWNRRNIGEVWDFDEPCLPPHPDWFTIEEDAKSAIPF